MSLQIALLRGINVGGRKSVSMADLRDMLGELGFAEARSLLQSGNLVFQSTRHQGSSLERLLEKHSTERLEMAADYIVRSASELKKIVAGNPFAKEAKTDPSHLVVMFLKDAPAAKSVKALQDAIQGPEYLECHGKQLYIAYPDGIGRSKLTGALIERTLGTRGTARNWNTVAKLFALCE